jgi:hypothetical protein
MAETSAVLLSTLSGGGTCVNEGVRTSDDHIFTRPPSAISEVSASCLNFDDDNEAREATWPPTRRALNMSPLTAAQLKTAAEAAFASHHPPFPQRRIVGFSASDRANSGESSPGGSCHSAGTYYGASEPGQLKRSLESLSRRGSSSAGSSSRGRTKVHILRPLEEGHMGSGAYSMLSSGGVEVTYFGQHDMMGPRSSPVSIPAGRYSLDTQPGN